jgi:ribosome-binding protein aMBF1 (putative translation factor)
MAKTLRALKAELLTDPEVREAYDEQAPEYAVARAVIAARIKAGLSQEQLAQRMNTQQSFIARLESGRALPSIRTMQKLAEATGTRLELQFRQVG